ncbi:MAG: glycosyltransferase family 8 protein [Patescibacteria group bacterium]|jgi:lipopolysaccharide biosynthesis glycosyltransferase
MNLNNKKNIIPIVFTFDDNYIVPAGVAIKSLLHSGKRDTWYKIYCLYNNLSDENRKKLDKIAKINWLKIDNNIFANSPVTSEYPVDVYYRLMIHDILPQHEKIIYSDVDVLFHDDLSEIYNMDLDNAYWAGVPLEKNEKVDDKIISFQKGNPDDPKYLSGHTKFTENKNEFIFASGFMVINSKKMRQDNMTQKFLETIKTFKDRIKMFDLDVLNLACQKNSIKKLPFSFCVFEDILYAKNYRETNSYPFLEKVFSNKELVKGIINPVISHYTGSNFIRVWDRKEDFQPQPYRIFFDLISQSLLQLSY